MRILTTRVIAALVVLVASAGVVGAAGPVPSPSEVLFDTPHLNKLDAGSKVSYRLEQVVSEPRLIGAPIFDDITIAVERVSDDGKRDVNVAVFTGERARPEQKLAGLTGNPLLVVFLDRAIRSYAMIAGGKTAPGCWRRVRRFGARSGRPRS